MAGVNPFDDPTALFRRGANPFDRPSSTNPFDVEEFHFYESKLMSFQSQGQGKNHEEREREKKKERFLFFLLSAFFYGRSE